MRVGILTSVGRTLDAFFREIVADWESKGHSVFCAAGTPPAEAALTFDVIEGLTQRPSAGCARVPKRIAEWADARQLDVLITNTATASALARIPRMNCKLIYFCHGLHWNSEWSAAMLIERALIKRSDSIIAINEDDFRWLSHRHPNVAWLRQGVGVPGDRYRWSPVPDIDGLHLTWAGDFVARKRPKLAVEVAQGLNLAGVDLRLTMLGDGPLRSNTIELAHSLGLGDSVTFPGQAPVEAHIRRSHALLHTAEWEGLPRILLEGAVMGRQAFAFDVKGVRDVPNVMLAPDPDVHALVDLILKQPPLASLDPEPLRAYRTIEVSQWLESHVLSVID